MIEAKAGCTLCQEIGGVGSAYLGSSYARLVRAGRTHLASTEEVVALPSVGALDRTHLLLVPRAHLRALAWLDGEASRYQVQALMRAVTRLNAESGMKTIFFEHGMGTLSDTSGGCVDHAHLHALGTKRSIGSAIRRIATFVAVPSFDVLESVANRSHGYALLVEEDGSCFLANRPRLPPQAFRRVAAEQLEIPGTWNWRLDRRERQTRGVIDYYSRLSTVEAWK